MHVKGLSVDAVPIYIRMRTEGHDRKIGDGDTSQRAKSVRMLPYAGMLKELLGPLTL